MNTNPRAKNPLTEDTEPTPTEKPKRKRIPMSATGTFQVMSRRGSITSEDVPSWFRMTYAILDRFGAPIFMLLVTLLAFGIYAKWTRSDAKEDRQAFLAALEKNTTAVERLVGNAEKQTDAIKANGEQLIDMKLVLEKSVGNLQQKPAAAPAPPRLRRRP